MYTGDITGTISFYREVMGLRLLNVSESAVAFAAGHTELIFHLSDRPRPIYHFAFTIPSNQLDEALLKIKGRTGILPLPDGGTFADFSNWNAEAFYFYDNNGNILEYIVRHSLNNASTVPFSGESIYGISEIGLVTDAVPQLAEQLSQDFNVPFFAKQPRQEHFTVLGDDEGLFIIVVDGRHWYPTAIAASAFPVVVGFTDHSEQPRELRFGFSGEAR